jgi:hypothetical protein
MNRETWLDRALVALVPLFAEAGFTLPDKLHVSVGFPSRKALSTKNRRIGECWAGRISNDGVPHIFLSPVLDNGVEVLATFVHEIIHALVGTEHGHKKPFVEAMHKLGLEGKPTATVAGEQLSGKLQVLLNDLGPYPQPKFNVNNLREEMDKKKQTTRLLKATCPEPVEKEDDSPYNVRVTRVHLDKHGPPLCPCHREVMTVEGWPEEPEDAEEDGGE